MVYGLKEIDQMGGYEYIEKEDRTSENWAEKPHLTQEECVKYILEDFYLLRKYYSYHYDPELSILDNVPNRQRYRSARKRFQQKYYLIEKHAKDFAEKMLTTKQINNAANNLYTKILLDIGREDINDDYHPFDEFEEFVMPVFEDEE